MGRRYDTASRTVGNKKETANYSVDGGGFGYSLITDDIKGDFDFLISDLPTKLDEAMAEIDAAANITDGFEFSGGASASDISKARDELQKDINALKTSLATLNSAFKTDIDNINAELKYNFGWIIIGNVKGSVRTETVETTTNN